MQIIYSAGTTSPTSPRNSPLPSPRHRPKSPCTPRQLNYYEGWRPVMPGYKAPVAHHQQPVVVIERTVEVQHLSDATDTNLKDSIPDMPCALAITCLICNIVLPGLGTLLSGLSVLCCSTPRPRTRDKGSILWVNSWVALFQFLTTFLCLLGWIWSIMWGVSFISISGKSKTADSAEDEAEAEAEATNSQSAAQQCVTNSRTTTTTTTTTVSVTPPNGQHNTGEGDGPHIATPIIILQEPPIIIPPPEHTSPVGSATTSIINTGGISSAPAILDSNMTAGTGNGNTGSGGRRTLDPYNLWHQRILRRQESDDNLPSVLLTPDALEQFVLNNAPLPMDGATSDADQPPSGKG